jgi:hypothetical protein
MVLLPQSRERSCYVSREYWHSHRPDFREALIYAHTSSRTLVTCNVSLGSLTLPAPEGGDFVELVLLYLCTKWLTFILLRVSAAVLEMFEVTEMFNIIFFINLFLEPEISILGHEFQSFTFHLSKISFNSRHKLIVWFLERPFSVIIDGSTFIKKTLIHNLSC